MAAKVGALRCRRTFHVIYRMDAAMKEAIKNELRDLMTGERLMRASAPVPQKEVKLRFLLKIPDSYAWPIVASVAFIATAAVLIRWVI